jgi:hypothetical protein
VSHIMRHEQFAVCTKHMHCVFYCTDTHSMSLSDKCSVNIGIFHRLLSCRGSVSCSMYRQDVSVMAPQSPKFPCTPPPLPPPLPPPRPVSNKTNPSQFRQKQGWRQDDMLEEKVFLIIPYPPPFWEGPGNTHHSCSPL